MLTRKADSLADLSLCPVFRRKWSSIYESLQDARPSAKQVDEALYQANKKTRTTYITRGATIPHGQDQMPAPLKKEPMNRTAQGGIGGRPITVGYGYSTLALIPEVEGSWALPLRHERRAELGKSN